MSATSLFRRAVARGMATQLRTPQQIQPQVRNFAVKGQLCLATLGQTLKLFFGQVVNHDFGHEWGRHESYGHKNTGFLHRISTRIQRD